MYLTTDNIKWTYTARISLQESDVYPSIEKRNEYLLESFATGQTAG